MIEVVVLTFDGADEREMAIHAMPIRTRYLNLLPKPESQMPENKTYGTSRGQLVDDAEIERLAAEAEVGYEPATLRRRGGRPLMGTAPAEVVPVRLDPTLRTAVEKRAELDHTTTSDVIREALRHYLHVA